MNTKQVIVIRKDLKMRRGKEIAQGAHASISFLVKRVTTQGRIALSFSEAECRWMRGLFKKVCVQVSSCEELFEIHRLATEAGLESHLITDNGLTEFKNILTPTCLAIGPDIEEKIDKITGHLELY